MAPLSLIENLEGDDEAAAKLEDEAIWAAERAAAEPDAADDVAAMIERLTNGEPATVHEG